MLRRVLLLTGVFVLALAPAASAQYAGAAVTASPSAVTPGGTVTLTATGFGGSEQVRFQISSAVVGTATANAAGTAVLTTTAPTAAGTYTVTATGLRTGTVATTTLTVTAAQVTTTTVGGLPPTGSNSFPWIRAAAILLVVGAAMAFVARRRFATS